jgi:hypothetical protein
MRREKKEERGRGERQDSATLLDVDSYVSDREPRRIEDKPVSCYPSSNTAQEARSAAKVGVKAEGDSEKGPRRTKDALFSNSDPKQARHQTRLSQHLVSLK